MKKHQCGFREIMRYITTGMLAFVIAGVITGTVGPYELASVSALAYAIAMGWVLFRFKDFRKEKKIAFAIFLLSGVILFRQVIEFVGTGNVTNPDLWWIADTAIALFALMIASMESKKINE